MLVVGRDTDALLGGRAGHCGRLSGNREAALHVKHADRVRCLIMHQSVDVDSACPAHAYPPQREASSIERTPYSMCLLTTPWPTRTAERCS